MNCKILKQKSETVNTNTKTDKDTSADNTAGIKRNKKEENNPELDHN